MKRIIFILLIFISVTGFARGNEQGKFSLFSLKNLYFFSMVQWVSDPLNEYGYNNSSDFTVLYGAGYNILNYHDKIFLNLEFDYFGTDYRFYYLDYSGTRRVYSISVDLEYKFRRKSNFVVYGGMGFALIEYPGMKKNNIIINSEQALVGKVGIKYRIMRNLRFRTEIRTFWDFYDGGGYYHYDYYYNYYDVFYDDTYSIAFAFTAGVELHL